MGTPKYKHPLGIPDGEVENMRRFAHHVAELEQKRIALTDEEAALFEAYIYENIRRQYTGERAIQHPDFWHATVFQGHLSRAARREASFAPSCHFVADMGTDEAWTNLPGGPSESRVSGYYKVDIPRWRTGKYKRLAVEADAVGQAPRA